MKRLIIYDLDGTLVDTREDIALSANHMLKEMSHPLLPHSTIARSVGRGLHHLIASCLGTSEIKQIEKGAKIYRQYYAEHMLDHTVLYPGAKEILDYFKGRLQAVITNKPNPFTYEILKALGVSDYFVEIVAGDSDYPKKPDPSAVFSIMKKEKVAAGETLFVGDSLVDIQTARNAGVATVVITHGFEDEDALKSAQPDAIFNGFKELLEWIKRKNW